MTLHDIKNVDSALCFNGNDMQPQIYDIRSKAHQLDSLFLCNFLCTKNLFQPCRDRDIVIICKAKSIKTTFKITQEHFRYHTHFEMHSLH